MLTTLRRLLDFELNIAELVGIGILVAGPYLLTGVVWTSTHASSLHGLRNLELTISLLGSIVLWPALALGHVCLR